MDSSDTGGEGGGLGDWSAGTIVWVRRRNGSWWPGRILGQEELAASHLMSPRSGTPVKLLGREDASVDWYNLEKSKRVKAFRCGDFDGCIQKAEASQGISTKKREKYARREDAILHALELERKQLALEYQKQGISMDVATSKASDYFKREVNNYSSEFYFRNEKPDVPYGKYSGQKAQLVNSAWSNLDESMGNVDYRYKSKCRKKREEETSEAIQRTRELRQYFVHVASKRKLSQSTALGDSHDRLSNGMNDLPQAEHILGGINFSGGRKPAIDEKKKRAEGGTFEESVVKMRDRRRSLVQVLQSSAESPLSHSFRHEGTSGASSAQEVRDQMPVVFLTKRSKWLNLPPDSIDSHNPNHLSAMQKPSTGADFEAESYLQQPVLLSEVYTSSDLIKKNVTDSSEGECSETETEEEAELLHNTTSILGPHSDACDPYVNQASEEFGNSQDDEIPAPTYVPELNALEGVEDGSELGVSKWHMKGRRNNRTVTKRPMDTTDGNLWLDKSHGFLKGSLHRSYETNPKKQKAGAPSQRSLAQGKEELNYDLDETDLFAKDVSHPEEPIYYGKKHPSILKASKDTGQSYTLFNDSEFGSFKTTPPKWESDGASLIGRKTYWEEPSSYQRNCTSRLGGEVGPMLFHVDLKVQGSYQGEHVPLVSMSRWNGKAIVGHPVQIEILEDGSTCKLISGSWIGLEGFRAAQPVWRTGRRTAMLRVPRPNTTRTALEVDDDGSFLHSDWEPAVRKGSTLFNHQARLAKRSISNARKTSSSKSHKKSSKKESSSSQKVRTLSSISTSRKLYGGASVGKPSRDTDIFGGLIKPEGTVPLVTCVPMKVVFSRILEAVGRPPIATAHRIKMAIPAVRDPPP